MDLHHLRSFVAVAELLSYRRAAERLHITRPPLTRQIIALEEEVGARLLVRGRTKAVSLTDAGGTFLIHAKRTLASAEAARTSVREAVHGASGQLSVTGCALLAAPVMRSYLKEFRSKFPSAEVSFVHATHAQEISALSNGRSHLAISATFFEKADRRFECRLLATIPLVVVMPGSHPLARRKGKSVDLAMLNDEVLVTPTMESEPSHTEFFAELRQRLKFTPREIRQVDGAENILGMVAAGYGVAILAACAVSEGARGCAVRLLRIPAPAYKLRMLWLRDSSSKLLHNFLKVAEHVAVPMDYQHLAEKKSVVTLRNGKIKRSNQSNLKTSHGTKTCQIKLSAPNRSRSKAKVK